MSARGRSRALHVGRLGQPRGVHLRPVYDRLFEVLKESGKLFADDTTAPAERPSMHLTEFKGVLQVDDYAGYRPFAEHGDVDLAFCPKRDRLGSIRAGRQQSQFAR